MAGMAGLGGMAGMRGMVQLAEVMDVVGTESSSRGLMTGSIRARLRAVVGWLSKKGDSFSSPVCASWVPLVCYTFWVICFALLCKAMSLSWVTAGTVCFITTIAPMRYIVCCCNPRNSSCILHTWLCITRGAPQCSTGGMNFRSHR